MEVLPKWTKEKLALLGDAAHPFLPRKCLFDIMPCNSPNGLTLVFFLDQGQGAGVAIEDAATLAVVLPEGTSAEQVSQRLQLYQDFRYERAHKIQEYSRKAGQDIKDEDFDSQYSKDLDSALSKLTIFS